jgi:hypothetical protein
MEPILAMRSRVRRHMLTAFAGIALGIVTMVAGGAVVHLVVPASAAGIATAVVSLAGIAMIPIIGITSAFRNLRCPSCNGLVAMQVSNKFSAFGSFARNDCKHCGVQIFAAGGTRRFLVLVAIAVLVFFGGILSFTLAATRQHRAQSAASSGP